MTDKPRCEHCGSHDLIQSAPGCLRCGAPNCCQQCCRIATLELLNNTLTAKLKEAGLVEKALSETLQQLRLWTEYQKKHRSDLSDATLSENLAKIDQALSNPSTLAKEVEARIKAEQREADIKLIEASCENCGGAGFAVRTTVGHGCDGSQEDCDKTCPVPVAEQEQCEICARFLMNPITAIRQQGERCDG